MVSQATQTFVKEIIDYQIDYNIKLIIFGTIIFYAFLLFFIKRKLENDTFAKMSFNLFSTIYIYITVFFLPLFSIMMFRDYAAIDLWTLILQMYGGVFVITALTLIVFGWQKTLDILGIETNFQMMKREQKRKGEE